ncbi:MAG: 3-dehydroquinate synthase II [Deltaproteobacteria bacterium]|nr:MAG: 3-dehydroquinate synthase II [Deltaproteobacteria bacterium]
MKRKIWVKSIPFNKEIVLTALESGASGIIIPDGFDERVRELGVIDIISSTGDIRTGEDAVFFEISSGEQEDEICRISMEKLVILECSDWSVIPLENLIAKNADVAPVVRSFEEAKTAFGILEKGVSQIVVDTDSVSELKKIVDELSGSFEKIEFDTAVVERVSPLGMGDRICVDTCSHMNQGEGLLIGNTSSSMFLVHSETIENPYVNPRPFRVNAGPVHAYVRVPGDKTKYLCELKAGDIVLVSDFKGGTSEAVVGRIKQEKRPLMLVEAMTEKGLSSIILQNAETIRLTSPDGQAVSVVNLKQGDEILVFLQKGGRHFGHKIEETIIEK